MVLARLKCCLLTMLLGIAVLPFAANGHLMPLGKGTINIVGEKAYVILSLPVSAFRDIPVCADGVLSQTELNTHRGAMHDAVRKGLQIASGAPATIDKVLLNLPTGYDHDPDKSGEIVVMVVARMQGAPEALTFTSNLWAAQPEPLEIQVTVTEGGHTLKREVETLTADNPTHTFFAPKASAARSNTPVRSPTP
ncbi:MAG: hypothetical protein ACE366_13840 [Bradymonadia bacterium]